MNAMWGRCVNMQCGGGASGCKMAICASDGVFFGGVEWSSSLVTFHRNKGKNVKLTHSNTVASRSKDCDYDKAVS